MIKRGQTQISFGMIFSVILIIGFIAFAVWGINKFLDVNKFAQLEKFKNDIQADIDNVWKSTGGSSAPMEYTLPKKIERVCFIDGEFENMYFVPASSDYDGAMLRNVDIGKTVEESSSRPKELCIDSTGGEIRLTLSKDYGEKLVTISV